MFYAFEGVDGSGKTSQIAAVAAELRRLGYIVVTAHDPKGTPLADALRDIVLDKNIPADPHELTMLFSAARRSLATSLRPAVDSGAVVLVDRWTVSTLVYQSYLGVVPAKVVMDLDLLTGLHPDHMFYLDIDVNTALDRIADRSNDGDRFESRGPLYMEKLITAYRAVAADADLQDAFRLKTVDATQDLEAVTRDLVDLVVTAEGSVVAA